MKKGLGKTTLNSDVSAHINFNIIYKVNFKVIANRNFFNTKLAGNFCKIGNEKSDAVLVLYFALRRRTVRPVV